MKQDRRNFLKSAASGLAVGAAASLGISGRVRGADRPNVMLVIVDQMRLPRWFPAGAHLPNYERLKSQGVEFVNHFVAAVPCSPSRACLFTGLHMDQNGVKTNISPRSGQPALSPVLPNLGRLFQDSGYQTPYFGKWHLSPAREWKQDRLAPYGFELQPPDHSAGLFPGLTNDPKWTSAAVQWLANPANHRSPWFLTVSLINPHDICSFPRVRVPSPLLPKVIDRLPDNWDDDLKSKPRCQAQYQQAYKVASGDMRDDDPGLWKELLDEYYYLSRQMDRELGRLLAALEASGQAGRTVIVFTSDHGEMGGSHRLRAKGPFAYLENTNVPLVISGPGVPKALRSSALSQNVDLFPTLAGLIGVDAKSQSPILPGHDLAPALAAPESAALADHVLFSFTGNVGVARANRAQGQPGITAPQNIRALRARDWLYARYFDPAQPEQEFELYDLKNDPLEMHNLAGDPGYRDQQKEMAERLREAEDIEMKA